MASNRGHRRRLLSDSSSEYTKEDDEKVELSDSSSSSMGDDSHVPLGLAEGEEQDEEHVIQDEEHVMAAEEEYLLPPPSPDTNDIEGPSTSAPSKVKQSSKKLIKMDRKQMMTVLAKSPNPFHSSTSALHTMYKTLHNYWLNQISAGYNILLYGYGSKLKVMQDFCKENLSGSWHLVVNGFFPGLTIKQILDEMCSNVLDHKGSFKNHIHQCNFICTSFCNAEAAGPDEFFLIVHNIDGMSLREEKAQTALSLLAACPKIHVIASIDHLNAPLLWDKVALTRYNWAWQDATTFEPYSSETSYENSILLQQSGALAMSSLTHVLQSLPERAQKIFELMATYHLEHKQDAAYAGQSFTELYRKCRERFLSNSDSSLRAQLTEFLDHKLIKSRKTMDGTETLIVLVDENILEQFINREEHQ